MEHVFTESMFLVGFVIFIAAILILDMLVIDRKAHVVSIKEAGSWTAVWIILALAFAVFIYFHGDMVIFLIHSKRSENHHHHEEIIYRERLLYQITRDVGDSHIVSVLLQTPLIVVWVQFEMRSIARCYQLQVVEVLDAVHHVTMEVDENGEGERENNPYCRP